MSTQHEEIVDLHEDLRFPVQCWDDQQDNQAATVAEHNDVNDFIDLQRPDVPVQCTEPSVPRSAPRLLSVLILHGGNITPLFSANYSTELTYIPRCLIGPYSASLVRYIVLVSDMSER